MPIVISSEIKKKLPKAQAKDLEKYLQHKYEKCHLCEQKMNFASDVIYADHDEPLAEGGSDNRDNLWLAHKQCNDFKRNNPSLVVRPYLKFKAFLDSKPVNVKYGECLSHFKIGPQQITLINKTVDQIEIHVPNGRIQKCSIFRDRVNHEEIEYIYVELSRNSIYSDDECQPRVIKLSQVWSIFNDLNLNPLYEAPGCRAQMTKNGQAKVLMFDGQHKTIANWLLGNETIVVKLYLSLSKAQTIQLVNSIQGRIKKLPLSPLEQAVKLAHECKDLYDLYIELEDEEPSEARFIKFIEPQNRKRALQALKASFIDSLIENQDLTIIEYVEGKSKTKVNSKYMFKESTFKKSILDRLLHTKPLSVQGQEGADMRARESKNVLMVLNLFVAKCLDPIKGKRSPAHEKRVLSMIYQSSLQYIADLLKKVVNHTITANSIETTFLDKEISKPYWKKIEAAIDRIAAHPIWTSEFETSKSKNLKYFYDSIQKHQNIDEAFKKIGLTIGYVVGLEEVPSNWASK